MAQVVFCPCVLKILNHFRHFLPRNGELNVKKKTCLATKGRGLLPRNLETDARKAWIAEI